MKVKGNNTKCPWSEVRGLVSALEGRGDNDTSHERFAVTCSL